jgi:hypothetical protein
VLSRFYVNNAAGLREIAFPWRAPFVRKPLIAGDADALHRNPLRAIRFALPLNINFLPVEYLEQTSYS